MKIKQKIGALILLALLSLFAYSLITAFIEIVQSERTAVIEYMDSNKKDTLTVPNADEGDVLYSATHYWEFITKDKNSLRDSCWLGLYKNKDTINVSEKYRRYSDTFSENVIFSKVRIVKILE